MIQEPLLLYIPGLLPKPDAETHRDALLRCLLAGIQRVDPEVAQQISGHPKSFDIVSWTYDFYGQHRDFALDAASVVDVIEQRSALRIDINEATSTIRRLARWLYTLGDMLPFLIPHVANERMELHLRDLRRYCRNDPAGHEGRLPSLHATSHVVRSHGTSSPSWSNSWWRSPITPSATSSSPITTPSSRSNHEAPIIPPSSTVRGRPTTS